MLQLIFARTVTGDCPWQAVTPLQQRISTETPSNSPKAISLSSVRTTTVEHGLLGTVGYPKCHRTNVITSSGSNYTRL